MREARRVAFPPGEFIGQESFVTAEQVRTLARAAGIDARTHLLDLCCGVAGPGLLIAAESGCRYLGVDADPHSVAEARRRASAARLSADVEVARVPPLPRGRFDAVLLLETLLAFRSKEPLLQAVGSALDPGGRFIVTVEEGEPLSTTERRAMPASGTVWPVTRTRLDAALERVRLRTVWEEDWTAAHAEITRALARSYAGTVEGLRPGDRAVATELVRSHMLWSDWMDRRRIRKLALVAQRM